MSCERTFTFHVRQYRADAICLREETERDLILSQKALDRGSVGERRAILALPSLPILYDGESRCWVCSKSGCL